MLNSIRRFCFLVLILFIISTITVKAQNTNTDSSSQMLVQWLEVEGFENIQALQQNDTLVIAYENRLYRFEVNALATIINKIPLPNIGHMILVPKYLNNPMLSIKFSKNVLLEFRSRNLSADAFLSDLKFEFDVDKWIYYLKKERQTNKTYFKIDSYIKPILRMQIGNYNVPIRRVIDVAPTIEMQLAKGMLLTAQTIIPTLNNFDDDNSVNAGIISLSQNARLYDNAFISLSAGIFSNRRAGVELLFKNYFMDGRLGIDTRLGLSGWSKISGEQDSFFDQDNYFIGRIGVDYRVVKYDLNLRLDYGTFLYNDQGLRADVYRQFGEVNIGFFLQNSFGTSKGSNAGFNFKVPLVPKKYYKLKKIRIRPSNNFNWEYRFRGFIRSGVLYNTGNNIISRSLEFNPDFMKNNLVELLEY